MRPLVPLLLIAPFAAPPATAQEIVVTGRGLAPPAGDAAYDMITLDRAAIERSASGRLEDILRDAAGFQQFRRSDSRSAQPTSQGATLRGLGGNASSRALILLDGVPMIDPFGGWVSFAALDPARLSRIRVTRGGGGGVYGSGALAGTIELTSAGADEAAPLHAALAYGSRASVDADAAVSAPLGGGFASLSGSYARGDGSVPIVAAARGPVDGPAPYRQASARARAVVPVNGETELQANAMLLYDHRTRGTAFTPNRNVGADASLRLVGHGHWGWEALGYLQVRQFSSGFASVNAARTTVTQTLDQYNVPATGAGGRVELRPPIGDGIELRLGGDARQTRGETRELFTYVAGKPTRLRNAGGRTRIAGAFAEAAWTPVPALTLAAGGRIDRWRIEDGHLIERTIATQALLTNAAFADRAGWRPSARGGASFAPLARVTLRAAAYLGWRLPTLNELYRPFRAGADATAANAALRPERLRGADAGIEWRPVDGLRLALTGYANRLADAIANVTLATGPGSFPGVGFVAAGGAYRMRQNLDAIRSRGLEAEARAQRGPWSLDASYAYTDARVRASGAAAALDGLRPAQTPRHQASATLGWNAGRAAASATLRYVSGQYDDDQNGRPLADAVTVDAVVAVPVRAGLVIEARGENLGDRRVEAANSGNGLIERATPRTLWVGLRYDLGR